MRLPSMPAELNVAGSFASEPSRAAHQKKCPCQQQVLGGGISAALIPKPAPNDPESRSLMLNATKSRGGRRGDNGGSVHLMKKRRACTDRLIEGVKELE